MGFPEGKLFPQWDSFFSVGIPCRTIISLLGFLFLHRDYLQGNYFPAGIPFSQQGFPAGQLFPRWDSFFSAGIPCTEILNLFTALLSTEIPCGEPANLGMSLGMYTLLLRENGGGDGKYEGKKNVLLILENVHNKYCLERMEVEMGSMRARRM